MTGIPAVFDLVSAAMPRKQDFTLEQLQASLFLPATSNISSNKIVGVVLKNFAEVFDGEMQVLPIPTGAPSEIPRVILQSSDGKRRFNAGPSRIDFVIVSPESIGAATEEAKELIAVYSEKLDVAGNRLSFIATRSCPDDNPAQTLIERFCNESSQQGPFARSATFEINNHKEFQPHGLDYKVNSWVRCGCLKDQPASSIIVLQDLNTLATEPQEFRSDKIRIFFDTISVAADEIFDRYFPG